MATVFGNAPVTGQSIENDGQVVRVGHTFWAPDGSQPQPYMITGARIYINPSLVASLPPTVILRLWETPGWLNVDMLREETITIGAGGWRTAVWDTPVPMTGDIPYWVVAQFPDNSYITGISPGDDAVIGTDGYIRLSAEDAHPQSLGWHRTGFVYGTDAVPNPPNPGTFYSLDIVTNSVSNQGGTASLSAISTMSAGGNAGVRGNGLIDFFITVTASGFRTANVKSGTGTTSAVSTVIGSGQGTFVSPTSSTAAQLAALGYQQYIIVRL